MPRCVANIIRGEQITTMRTVKEQKSFSRHLPFTPISRFRRKDKMAYIIITYIFVDNSVGEFGFFINYISSPTFVLVLCLKNVLGFSYLLLKYVSVNRSRKRNVLQFIFVFFSKKQWRSNNFVMGGV